MTELEKLRIDLTAALIDLIKVASGKELPLETNILLMEGLMKLDPMGKNDEAEVSAQIEKTRNAKRTLLPFCEGCSIGCSLKENFDMNIILGADEETRSAKRQLLISLYEMAGYVHFALLKGISDDAVNNFFWKSLRMLGMDFAVDDLWPIVEEAGGINIMCLDLFEKANRTND